MCRIGYLVELQGSERHVSGCTKLYVMKKHFQPLFFEYMALAFVRTLQDFVEHYFLGSIFGCKFVLSVVGCMLYDCCKFLRNFSPVYVLHASSPFTSVM